MVGGRTLTDWGLDAGGFLVSLVAAPLATGSLAVLVMLWLWPLGSGAVSIPPWAAFLLSFALLDYVQYWGHRFLHRRSLWPVHLFHHTLPQMHAAGAVRHSLWEPVFNPATWINGAIVCVLADRSWYLIGISTGLMLDFWRHSTLSARAGNPLARLLRRVLVTPADHAMHHVEGVIPVNFGNNLIIWDRYHHTYAAPIPLEPPLGVSLPSRPWCLLLWPARPSTLAAAVTLPHAG